jgi:sulfur transfer protein SufE
MTGIAGLTDPRFNSYRQRRYDLIAQVAELLDVLIEKIRLELLEISGCFCSSVPG